jgi:iron complex transport system substrate-binding protein
LNGVLGDILVLGKATGRESEAKALVELLQGRVIEVSRRAADVGSRPAAVCIEWYDPVYVAGHWVPEMVRLAGGRDCLGRTGERSRVVEWSEVTRAAPDILVLMPCGFDLERGIRELELLEKLAGWQQLPAVKARRVFAVDGNAYFSRPGPRLFEGLEFLAHMTHPEVFPAPPPLHTVRKIY